MDNDSETFQNIGDRRSICLMGTFFSHTYNVLRDYNNIQFTYILYIEFQCNVLSNNIIGMICIAPPRALYFVGHNTFQLAE